MDVWIFTEMNFAGFKGGVETEPEPIFSTRTGLDFVLGVEPPMHTPSANFNPGKFKLTFRFFLLVQHVLLTH